MKHLSYAGGFLVAVAIAATVKLPANVTNATARSGGLAISVDITHNVPSSTPPAPPTMLTGQMTANDRVILHWNPAEAANGRTIIRYDIYLNGKKVGSTTATEFTAPFDSSPSALQFYSVIAIDDKGNASVASGEALVNPEAPVMLQVKEASIYDQKFGVRGYASSARMFKHVIGTEYYKEDSINCGGPNAIRFESNLRIEEAFAVDGGASGPSTIDVSGTLTLLWPDNGYNLADNWILHSSRNYAVPTSNNITSHGSWPVGFYGKLPHALDSSALGRKGGVQTESNWHLESIDSVPTNCYSKVAIRDISLSEEDTNEDLFQRGALHFANVDAVLKLAAWNVYIPSGSTTGSVPPAQAYLPYAPVENIASRYDVKTTSLGYTGVDARNNRWGYYRWVTNRAGMLRARWLEVLDTGAGPVVFDEHDVSLFGSDSGTATETFATMPTDVPQGNYGYGYRYICQVPTGIELQTPSVHPVTGQPRLFQRDALFIGEAVDLDIGAFPTSEANRVISGTIQLSDSGVVRADIGGDPGVLRLVAVDPAIVSAQGLKAAVALGTDLPSGTNIYPYLYPSYGSTTGPRNLVAVALAGGHATLTIHLQNYYYQFDVVKTIDVFPVPGPALDANRDGVIKLASEDASDTTSATQPYRFWLNDDDDNADMVPDANDAVVNGANDLKDFYPVFLDLKQLVTVLTPSSSVVYKLKQEEGALNFVYTNLTRATAFSYAGGTLTTGFGPSFGQPASSATTQPITATGADLFGGSSSFLDAVQNHDGGVLLIEGRQLTDKPLVLSVEKDGAVIAEVKLELCAMHLGKLWETSNKTNQIFNRTKKDDSTGNLGVQETEGDATYAVPRNNLYVVADPADNKLKVSLDLGIPATSRTKFIAAAWDGATKVAGSDAAFPADASQSATLQIAASATAETKEYRIKLGRDANGNGLLDDSEASPMEIYRRKDTGELRFATVKGISNAKYDEHKSTIVGKIGFLGQSQPGFPAKYARSFLALFYYQGDFNRIATGVQPNGGTVIRQLDAFANGVGYAEWLTHNSGAVFSDGGVAPVKEYDWNETSEVAEFFAARTPFALESTITNGQGYSEFQTATGATLKTFYGTQVKTAAEQSLQNSPVGTTVTFPLDGGWYEFPRTEAPNQFKSISPGNWVTPSTQIIGTDDGYSGFGALFTDIIAGTDQFNDFDAFGTIGRGRVLNPRYKITVKKEDTGIFTTNIEYKVSAVEFTCDLEDLYDFNYEDGTLPSHAAAMQIGWGKGANGPTRDQGVIFRHKIHIDHTYTYPFDQTVIVNPGP